PRNTVVRFIRTSTPRFRPPRRSAALRIDSKAAVQTWRGCALTPTTVAGVFVVLRFTGDDGLLEPGQEALAVLAGRPGFQQGQLARAYDDPTVWCLTMQWESVGAYRRALSSYEVKIGATALLARAWPESSACEPLLAVEPGQGVQILESDRAGIA